jgi:hypothetical protein
VRRVRTGGGGWRVAGSGDEPRWRVFVSRTSELRDFPKGTSYVAAVERAIIAAGHVPVDMTDFPAADRAPADLCAERVRGCDVYIGLLGTRYGSPVLDKPEVSYTELEFDTATDAGLDRLVFLLDTDADDVRIPPSALIDRDFGARQDDFRRRVRESKLVTRSFADPGELSQLVERSLRELADTRTRLRSGIQREQVPAEAQPVRASKFVNPPPAVAPAWFQGRRAETARLARYLSDPGIRLVTVTGPGGIGKTSMVCRLLKGLEAGRIPGADDDAAAVTVGGIVYLSRNGVHKVEYPTLVADLLRLLSAEEAGRLQRLYQNPQHSPAAMMLALLEAFPAGEPDRRVGQRGLVLLEPRPGHLGALGRTPLHHPGLQPAQERDAGERGVEQPGAEFGEAEGLAVNVVGLGRGRPGQEGEFLVRREQALSHQRGRRHLEVHRAEQRPVQHRLLGGHQVRRRRGQPDDPGRLQLPDHRLQQPAPQLQKVVTLVEHQGPGAPGLQAGDQGPPVRMQKGQNPVGGQPGPRGRAAPLPLLPVTRRAQRAQGLVGRWRGRRGPRRGPARPARGLGAATAGGSGRCRRTRRSPYRPAGPALTAVSGVLTPETAVKSTQAPVAERSAA